MSKSYKCYNQKEWNAVDDKLRGIAVKCIFDGYKICNRDIKREAEIFKMYYEKDYPESYKEKLTDEDVELVLMCIYTKEHAGTQLAFKRMLIGFAAVVIALIALIWFLF